MSSGLEEQQGQDSEVSQNGQHHPGVSSRIAMVCVWGGGMLGHFLVVDNASKRQYRLIFQDKSEAHFLCEIMNL